METNITHSIAPLPSPLLRKAEHHKKPLALISVRGTEWSGISREDFQFLGPIVPPREALPARARLPHGPSPAPAAGSLAPPAGRARRPSGPRGLSGGRALRAAATPHLSPYFSLSLYFSLPLARSTAHRPAAARACHLPGQRRRCFLGTGHVHPQQSAVYSRRAACVQRFVVLAQMHLYHVDLTIRTLKPQLTLLSGIFPPFLLLTLGPCP